jgi:hypothetical protein
MVPHMFKVYGTSQSKYIATYEADSADMPWTAHLTFSRTCTA